MFDRAEFVLLTTFRRTGEPVATPMWFAKDGDLVVFSTPAGVGKLKRLRHTTRVEMQECSRRGQPVPGSSPVPGTARVVTDDAERRHVEQLLDTKYRWQWKVAQGVERVLARVRRQPPPKPRVAIIVTPGRPA